MYTIIICFDLEKDNSNNNDRTFYQDTFCTVDEENRNIRNQAFYYS